tara:strand:+ start:220 stop:1158 length:939 start_codon:yes stop_codon:yes gene_type:complete
MNYNFLYIKYKYPYYLNNNINNEFTFSNIKNYSKYICIQELIHHSNFNVNYYYLYIHNPLFNGDLNRTREILFSNIQKFNIAFSKLLFLIKKRYKKSKNDTNVLMEDFKKKNIKIIQDNNLYIFDYFELYKIIKESFYFNCDKCPKNIIIKNPYTNIKINYYNLIQIYFELLKYGKIPNMFFLFFKCNFSSKIFKENYLINLYINNFKNNFYNLSNTGLLRYISDMLNSDEKFILFNNINDDLKLKLFKNITLFYYLKIKIELYFIFDYKTITNSYINKYYNYLNNFKKNNPFFGRIIYKNNKYSVNTDYTF